MEESKSWSEGTGKCSEETAETLQKLRTQADESLNIRRRHLSDMETELNHHIQQVAAELAHDFVATCAPAETASQEELQTRLETLTAQVEQETHQQEQLQGELATLQQHQSQLQQQLQESLAQRTEAATHASTELANLRAERDALTARVGELEAAPAADLDTDGQEQIADLKQRLEMALDEVQQQKQKNNALQDHLETLQTGQAAPPSDGPLDWQAQKARLLASLAEEEDDSPLPEQRQQERTTIESTVSITDQVVADKDHEISGLRQQLESLQMDPPAEHLAEENQTDSSTPGAILDEDEIIQRERDRLKQLQQEWEEKLRQAELDISIERATLARDHAALEEKLTAVQNASAADQPMNDPQRPRRRWLAALGIQGDDEA